MVRLPKRAFYGNFGQRPNPTLLSIWYMGTEIPSSAISLFLTVCPVFHASFRSAKQFHVRKYCWRCTSTPDSSLNKLKGTYDKCQRIPPIATCWISHSKVFSILSTKNIKRNLFQNGTKAGSLSLYIVSDCS